MANLLRRCGLAGSALLAAALASRAQLPRLVADLDPTATGYASTRPRGVGVVGDVLFVNNHDELDQRLWRTDGTVAGSYPLGPRCDGVTGCDAHAVDGRVLLYTVLEATPAGPRTRLMRSDGTHAGTYGLPPDDGFAAFALLGTVSGRLLYTLAEADGVHLWSSDGSPEGTWRIASPTWPGQGHVQPGRTLGPWLLFRAFDARGGELWRSNGTAAGTTRLRDLLAGPASSLPSLGIPLGRRDLLFTAAGMLGRELWRTDATARRTRQVVDLSPGRPGTSFLAFAADPDRARVYFLTDGDRAGQVTLFVSDGTMAGTRRVMELPERVHEETGQWRVLHGKLYFPVPPPGSRHAEADLWVTDGTRAGTSRLAEICPNLRAYPEVAAVVYARLTPFGHRLAFAGRSADGDCEPWLTDGTGAGTGPILDLCEGCDSAPHGFATLGSRLLFAANGSQGLEIYATGGNPPSTRRLTAFASSQPLPRGVFLQPVGDRLWFTAEGAAGGIEPWFTDGTGDGTRGIDLSPRSVGASSHPRAFAATAGGVLFAADARGGHGIFHSDGTRVGTRAVGAVGEREETDHLVVTAAGHQLAFARSTVAPFTIAVWGRRAIADAFVLLAETPAEGAGAAPAAWRELADGRLVWARGGRLWVTDATAAGTFALADGVGVRAAEDLSVLAGRVVFERARALWETDGTVEGTRPVGAAGGLRDPDCFAAFGDDLVLAARTDATTHELYRLASTGTLERLSTGVLSQCAVGVVADSIVWIESGGVAMASDGTAGGTRELGTLATGGVFYRHATTTATHLFVFTVGPPGPSGVVAVGPQSAATLPVLARTGLDAPVRQWAAVGNRLLFVGEAEDQSRALWSSDGTVEGTVRLDLPGVRVTGLRALGARVLVRGATEDDQLGWWSVDALGQDVRFHGAAADLEDLALANGRLFFAGSTPATGRELFALRWRR